MLQNEIIILAHTHYQIKLPNRNNHQRKDKQNVQDYFYVCQNIREYAMPITSMIDLLLLSIEIRRARALSLCCFCQHDLSSTVHSRALEFF